MTLIFNPKLKELKTRFQEGTLNLEQLREELDLAEKNQVRIEQLKIAEESNSKGKLQNAIASFDSKIEGLFNGRTPFQSRYNQEDDCVEVFLIPNKVVARFGRDELNSFRILGGEVHEMTKKEDIDLSNLKKSIYILLEECFK